ncbi:MAG: hypothetical protein JWQ40_1163 [Segetibacter sp.]|nr:hypothetical protein [Segetibacter sp.]
MDLEQVKTEWQQYNQKLELSQRLNEQLIMSILRERSRSRVSKIRRDNTLYMILMVLNLVLLSAIFAGNPFDFKYNIQYIPYGALAIGVILAIFSLIRSFKTFDVNLNNVSLDSFLKKTIYEYEKNKKMEKWFGILVFSAGVLTALSFLPNKLKSKELWPALGETVLTMGITIAVYFIAVKAGAFNDRKREGFENDLRELNELKAISSELRD